MGWFTTRPTPQRLAELPPPERHDYNFDAEILGVVHRELTAARSAIATATLTQRPPTDQELADAVLRATAPIVAVAGAQPVSSALAVVSGLTTAMLITILRADVAGSLAILSSVQRQEGGGEDGPR